MMSATTQAMQLLNNQAALELKSNQIEEAQDTLNRAVTHFVSALSSIHAIDDRKKATLQKQAFISSILQRKMGHAFQLLGKERDDEDLAKYGDMMIRRSEQLLSVCRRVFQHLRPLRPNIHDEDDPP